MPERVVDLLEPIEIEKEDREAAFPAPGVLQRQVELFHEQPPVRQERQTVVVGQETDLALDLLAVRDVLRRPEHADGGAVLVENHLGLFMDGTLRSVREDDAEVEAVRTHVAQSLHHGARHRVLVGGVHALQLRVARRRPVSRVDPEQTVHLLRPVQLAGFQVPLPVAEPRESLRLGEPLLALQHLVERAPGAQHVTDAVDEDEDIDRLHAEVGRARLVGLAHRLVVVEAGEHQDRRHVAARQPADRRARLEPVHSGHADVEENQVRLVAREQRHGLRAVHRLDDLEALGQKRFAQEAPHRGVVVRDEDEGAAGLGLDVGHE